MTTRTRNAKAMGLLFLMAFQYTHILCRVLERQCKDRVPKLNGHFGLLQRSGRIVSHSENARLASFGHYSREVALTSTCGNAHVAKFNPPEPQVGSGEAWSDLTWRASRRQVVHDFRHRPCLRSTQCCCGFSPDLWHLEAFLSRGWDLPCKVNTLQIDNGSEQRNVVTWQLNSTILFGAKIGRFERR